MRLIDTNWISKIYLCGSRVSLVNFSRFAAVSIIAILILSSIYGYQMLKAVPFATQSMPFLGLFVCIALLFFALKLRRSMVALIDKPLHDCSLRKIIALVVLWFAFTVTFGELFIVTPAERIHVIKYSLLGMCLFYSLKRGSVLQRLLFAVICGFSMGIAEETLQYFLPKRVGDVRDVILDGVCAALGALMGCLSVYGLSCGLGKSEDAQS